MTDFNILVINPGSTSTEVAIFNNEFCVIKQSISHTTQQLSLTVDKQLNFRKKAILDFLETSNIDLKKLSAIAARGGRLKAVKSGTYKVDKELLKDSYSKENGNHVSKLAVILGVEIAEEVGCQVYIVDPISVDELLDEARISGIPEIKRKSLGHALNTKAVCRKTAQELNSSYNDINIVVAHLGGGTTISSHKNGKMIDLINDFEGAFTPERSGGLSNIELVKMCFSGKYQEEEILRKLEGLGGFYSYLGTKDFIEIESRIANGDEYSKLIMDAYLLQLTKELGSMVAVLEYEVDAISVTGSIAKSKNVIEHLKSIFSKIAPVFVYPGSFEVEALAAGVIRVLRGEETARNYSLESRCNEQF